MTEEQFVLRQRRRLALSMGRILIEEATSRDYQIRAHSTDLLMSLGWSVEQFTRAYAHGVDSNA
jgi:hypothetical protein